MENKGRTVSGWVTSGYQDRITGPNRPAATAVIVGSVEPGIVSLVEALNSIGRVETIASCQGHGRGAKWYCAAQVESEPYVLFRAPETFARQLAKKIYNRGAGGQLAYLWELSGYFYPDSMDELVWILRLRDASLPATWDTGKVRHDVASLADMVESIGS